jgi:hypothetical protein
VRRNFRGDDLKRFNAEAQSSQRRRAKRKAKGRKKLNTEVTEGRAQSSPRRIEKRRKG